MATKDDKPGFRDRVRQIGVAFSFTRRYDKLIIPLLLVAFLTPVLVTVVVAAWSGQWLLVPLGVLVGVLVALLVFGRRVTKATYAEVEGKPGAAAAILQSIRGNWRVTPAIAVTAQQDVIHRAVGRPGVVLISEGSPQRLRTLLAQEKKKLSRVVPDVPLYEVAVGNEEGSVPLRKLQPHLLRLPRNITPKQINAVEQRLTALGGMKLPIPKGPMPKSARALKGAKQQMYRGR